MTAMMLIASLVKAGLMLFPLAFNVSGASEFYPGGKRMNNEQGIRERARDAGWAGFTGTENDVMCLLAEVKKLKARLAEVRQLAISAELHKPGCPAESEVVP